MIETESWYTKYVFQIIVAVITVLLSGIGWLIKRWLDKRKTGNANQSKKNLIWQALQQRKPTPPSLTIDEISSETGISIEELNPLLYEMKQENIIHDGIFPGTFTRYKKSDIDG